MVRQKSKIKMIRQSVNIEKEVKLFLENAHFNISSVTNAWFKNVRDAFLKASTGEILSERDSLIINIALNSQTKETQSKIKEDHNVK